MKEKRNFFDGIAIGFLVGLMVGVAVGIHRLTPPAIKLVATEVARTVAACDNGSPKECEYLRDAERARK